MLKEAGPIYKEMESFQNHHVGIVSCILCSTSLPRADEGLLFYVGVVPGPWKILDPWRCGHCSPLHIPHDQAERDGSQDLAEYRKAAHILDTQGDDDSGTNAL
jgi:hypothetical protein